MPDIAGRPAVSPRRRGIARRRAPCRRARARPRRYVALLRAAAIAGPAIFASPATAQDIERERRLEAEIVDAILDGEPVHLDADGHSFLGIHTEAGGDGPRRAVIVLHGRGFHPDWAEVAAPLRIELPEHGWETLSLQMPVLEKTGLVILLYELGDPRRCWREWEEKPVGRTSAA